MDAPEASYYTKHTDHSVQCQLCPNGCVIAPGRTGRCQTRYNDDGTLRLLTYGQCAAMAVDPIEKKPLRRFHPRNMILSVGSWGCNLTCQWCQNWQIAHERVPTKYISPAELVEIAVTQKRQGNIGVAFTYNEPLLSFEYIRDTVPLLQQAGLAVVIVSNGYINPAPLQELLPFVDAWNIDLKGFTNDVYRQYCGATLEPVKETLRCAAAVSHVEVTTLIIPGLNDSPADMQAEAQWLAAIDAEIPLHLTRYFPAYCMTAPPTPIDTLHRLADIAKTYMRHVYIGNV